MGVSIVTLPPSVVVWSYMFVVVFGDVSTAVVTELESCMMGMQGKETAERLTLLRAQ